MNKRTLIGLLALAFCLAASDTRADAKNGKKTGSWDLSTDLAFYRDGADAPESYPFPLASVPQFNRAFFADKTGFSLASEQCNADIYFEAPDGSTWHYNPSGFTLSLSHKFWLPAGANLSGLAQFFSYDSAGYGDFASVTVNGHVLWHCDLNGFGPSYDDAPQSGACESWRFLAPEDGWYRLGFNIHGDDQLDSRAEFRQLSVLHGVPDATTTAPLLGLTLGLFAWIRRLLGKA